MKVSDIITGCDLKVICQSDLSRQITGVYAGDLLSWVMSHANNNECWITIMSNTNVLAVASLLDLSCVIISENVKPDEEFISIAKQKEINVLSSDKSTYELCALLSKALENE